MNDEDVKRLLELAEMGTLMPRKDIEKLTAIMEAKASVALDGDTHSVYDFPHVAFWDTCEEHLKHAREKHPKFAKVVSQFYQNEHEANLRHLRETNGYVLSNAPSIYNILREEVEEFMIELLRGDLDRAREEGADIIAVILRATEGDIAKEVRK